MVGKYFLRQNKQKLLMRRLRNFSEFKLKPSVSQKILYNKKIKLWTQKIYLKCI